MVNRPATKPFGVRLKGDFRWALDRRRGFGRAATNSSFASRFAGARGLRGGGSTGRKVGAAPPQRAFKELRAGPRGSARGRGGRGGA